MKFPPLSRVDTAAFADCLFLVGQAWVKRALGDDQGAVEYLADAMVMVPDGTIEMILCMIEDGALPEPVPGAMDPWLECCRQAGAGELRLTVTRSRLPRRLLLLPRVASRLRPSSPGACPGLTPTRTSTRWPRRPNRVRRIASPSSSAPRA
jgi:hypothetical protein